MTKNQTNTNTLDASLRKYLSDRGLFGQQIDSVMSILEDDVDEMGLNLDLGSPVDLYPRPVISSIEMRINSCALQWIDKHCPQHFARQMFGGK